MSSGIEDHIKSSFYVDLFDAIQHGDNEHREWLRDKIIQFAEERDHLTIPTERFTIKP